MGLNTIKIHQCSLESLLSMLSMLSQNLFSDPTPLGEEIYNIMETH